MNDTFDQKIKAKISRFTFTTNMALIAFPLLIGTAESFLRDVLKDGATFLIGSILWKTCYYSASVFIINTIQPFLTKTNKQKTNKQKTKQNKKKTMCVLISFTVACLLPLQIENSPEQYFFVGILVQLFSKNWERNHNKIDLFYIQNHYHRITPLFYIQIHYW